MKPEILIAAIYTPDQLAYYDDDFIVHHAPTPEEAEVAISKVGANVRAVVTVGSQAFTGAMMDAMPKLQIIIIRGAGFEGIDLIAAKARGVIVCNTPSTNYFSVAEHAMALLLSIGRRIPADFTAIQQGKWQEHKSQPVRYLIYNKHIGILGLGAIGAAIAQRAIAFETTVSYHNRSKRLDVPYAYSPSALDLACESDVLIVATPGGPETKHLVSAKVLDALGPKGYLVNVGRGSIVDQNALIDALHDRRIAGAALDVVDGEPEMPQRLLNAPNVIITPHIGGGSTESRLAVIVAVIANLLAGMAGLPVKNQLV
ncbi:MAG: 2-hydroxyacid dehydrogenase [Rhodospirillales bacterium]|jgi:lactate dehydrogenase-like 2-hydroxyacid dehydrogenase